MDKNLFHFLKDRKIFYKWNPWSGKERHYSDAKEFQRENTIIANRKRVIKKAKKKY
jgi:hypothetical protein